MSIGHRKEIRKLTFRALALRRSESRNCGSWRWFMNRNMELRCWLVHGNVKNNRINYLNELERSLIPWGLRVPIWKINFCSRVLRLSMLPRCSGKAADCICFLEWLWRLRYLATGLDASLLSFSTSRRCSGNRSTAQSVTQHCTLKVVTSHSICVRKSQIFDRSLELRVWEACGWFAGFVGKKKEIKEKKKERI